MAPDEHDDDFAVWPFRRELVDPFARVEAHPLPRPQPAPIAVWAPEPRRGPSPLRLALPVALAAFVLAAAGTAALGRSHEQPPTPPAVAQAR